MNIHLPEVIGIATELARAPRKPQAVQPLEVWLTGDASDRARDGLQQLAITLVDLRAPKQTKHGSFRGDVKIYPASVVKMFYLAAAHRWMEDGKLQDTAELRRAMRDMIVPRGTPVMLEICL